MARNGARWHDRDTMNMTDYEATRRSFRLRIPPDFSYTRDVVGAWAASHPEKVAMVAVGPGGQHRRELPFADLWRASNRVANALAGLFFQAEDGIRDDLVTGVQTCALPI